MIRTIIIGIVVIVVVVGGLLLVRNRHNSTNTTSSANGSKVISTNDKSHHFDIKLKQGKVDGTPATYVVNPGTALEFGVSSDKLGSIGLPTDPEGKNPQKITFTQSPVVFRLTAQKTGSYPLTFLQNGGSDQDVVTIGTIQIR